MHFHHLATIPTTLALLVGTAGAVLAEDMVPGPDDATDCDLRFYAGYENGSIEDEDFDGFRLGIDNHWIYTGSRGVGLVVGCDLAYQHLFADVDSDYDMGIVSLRVAVGPSFKPTPNFHLELTPYVGGGYGWADSVDGFVLPYGVELGAFGTTDGGFQFGGKIGYEWQAMELETDGGTDVDWDGDGFFLGLTVGARF